ncbi:PREDICTED: monocarboxylate transporter 13-like [Priapulus caudatus]|uniref:Monocarboxylate transporter 13-like n=1 Tax=Priapulus caudatus TaxID=37621 RepID=A0ABM1F4Y6_PRICU|nr:PREDICTED: monocarboxylate transporter 13-like [Priapulus caudatus]
MGGDDDDPEKKKKKKVAAAGEPPDGGWGWVVVAAGFVVNFIIVGQLRSYGILLVELMEVLGTSAALTTWVNGLANGLCFLMSPVMQCGSLQVRSQKGHRVGGIVSAVGMTAQLLGATAAVVLYISVWQCIARVGAGLLSTQSSHLPFYFKKKLSLGMGVSFAGSGIGFFSFPFIYEKLLDTYGYRGLFLVCGAITLNIVPMAFLFRPIAPAGAAARRPAMQTTLGTEERINANSNELQTRDDVTQRADAAEPPPPPPRKLKFHWEICQDVSFMVFIVAIMALIFGYRNNMTMLAVKADELQQQTTTTQDGGGASAATVLATLALTETSLRFVWAFFWDRGVLRNHVVRRVMMAAFSFVVGAMLFAVVAIETSMGLLIWTISYGAVVGGAMSPILIVMVDLLGPEKFSDGLGIMMLGSSVVHMFSPLLTGVIAGHPQPIGVDTRTF